MLEIDQLRDNDKLSAADALHLLELRAKHHPALFVSEGCCELILRLGRLVLGPGETLPPAFAVLGPQALIHLPSPSKVLEWFKLLATGDPVLPMHVLETMAKELSNKIWLDHTAPNAPGHGKWTLDDLVKLDRVLGKPICSLDAWIAVADSQISNRPWIAVEISGQQWHASTSMLTRSIPVAPTDEQKFLQLRILQRKLNITLQNADEGHIRLDAKKLQKIAFLCCALGGDDKCVALLKAIAKRVCEVLMQVQGDDEGLRLMESFFAADEWPFLRALFEEHAPAQWDTLQVCAGGWMEAQYLAANAGKTPQVELKFLERIIAPRSPQWLCDIRSAHSGATAWGNGSVRFDAEMLRLVVACATSTQGHDELKKEAAAYLHRYFSGLSIESRNAVLSQPGAQQAMDVALITFDLDRLLPDKLKEAFKNLTTANAKSPRRCMSMPA